MQNDKRQKKHLQKSVWTFKQFTKWNSIIFYRWDKNLIDGCTYIKIFVVDSLFYLAWKWGGNEVRTRTKLFQI